MANCTCSAGKVPGTLKFTWTGTGHPPYVWDGPPGYCNPHACSNSKCKANGCAQAKRGFCSRYGKNCGLDLKTRKPIRVCANESCPKVTGVTPPKPVNKPPVKTDPNPKDSIDAEGNATPECKKRMGVDADCCGYGGILAGPIGEWACVQGKSVTKQLINSGNLGKDIATTFQGNMPLVIIMGVAMGGMLLFSLMMKK